eukprot:gene2436-3006_t
MDKNIEKLHKLADKQIRTGGKGSVRRKKQPVHNNSASVDDKKLQAKLTSLGCRPIPDMTEVNLFKQDGNVVHFAQPKVQAAAKTFVVSGKAETKPLQDLFPGIIEHLGTDSFAQLKKLAENLKGQRTADDDVPDLVENFDAPQ